MGKMSDLLTSKTKSKFATDFGTNIHRELQRNPEIVMDKINCPEFFAPSVRTEVPIAGNINGKFISRRIDRLLIMDDRILFWDYKSDRDKSANKEKYIQQMNEYYALISAAFPNRSVQGWILWTHDFTLEEIVKNAL